MNFLLREVNNGREGSFFNKIIMFYLRLSIILIKKVTFVRKYLSLLSAFFCRLKY